MRNLQEQVKKAFCFTVWINCFSDLKNFANSRPSASNFKSFSRSLEHFFLTVGQNNFGNKIPFPRSCKFFLCHLQSVSNTMHRDRFQSNTFHINILRSFSNAGPKPAEGWFWSKWVYKFLPAQKSGHLSGYFLFKHHIWGGQQHKNMGKIL